MVRIFGHCRSQEIRIACSHLHSHHDKPITSPLSSTNPYRTRQTTDFQIPGDTKDSPLDRYHLLHHQRSFYFFFRAQIIATPLLSLQLSTITHTATITDISPNLDSTFLGEHPYQIFYQYEWDGASYEYSSYTYDESLLQQYGIDSPVEIEILSIFPAWSRIKGLSLNMFPYGIDYLILIFPVVGALMTFKAIQSNRREKKAYRDGIATVGDITFIGYDESATMNNRNPYGIQWEFGVNDQTYTGSLNHMDPEKFKDFESEKQLIVLYDINNPKINTIYL